MRFQDASAIIPLIADEVASARAAALIAADHDPDTLDFVCSDARLAGAAVREGFRVLDR